jgi:hypothetical protein
MLLANMLIETVRNIMARRRSMDKAPLKKVHIVKTIADPFDFEESNIKKLMDQILDIWEEIDFDDEFEIKGNKIILSGYRYARDGEETDLFDEETEYYEYD